MFIVLWLGNIVIIGLDMYFYLLYILLVSEDIIFVVVDVRSGFLVKLVILVVILLIKNW